MISAEERTRVELSANRRRFRREGVAVMVGDRDQRYPLRLASDDAARREIYVRPACRSEERKPSWVELLLEKLFA